MDPRFSDVQIASNFAVAQATAHSAVNRAKNPDLFPKYLHNFTRQIMSFDRACDLVKTAHNVGVAKFGCESQRGGSILVCSREMRFAKFVIVVVDVQHRLASEPDRGCGAVVGRHPEIAGFEVCLEYPALLCPE